MALNMPPICAGFLAGSEPDLPSMVMNRSWSSSVPAAGLTWFPGAHHHEVTCPRMVAGLVCAIGAGRDRARRAARGLLPGSAAPSRPGIPGIAAADTERPGGGCRRGGRSSGSSGRCCVAAEGFKYPGRGKTAEAWLQLRLDGCIDLPREPEPEPLAPAEREERALEVLGLILATIVPQELLAAHACKELAGQLSARLSR